MINELNEVMATLPDELTVPIRETSLLGNSLTLRFTDRLRFDIAYIMSETGESLDQVISALADQVVDSFEDESNDWLENT